MVPDSFDGRGRGGQRAKGVMSCRKREKKRGGVFPGGVHPRVTAARRVHIQLNELLYLQARSYKLFQIRFMLYIMYSFIIK